ncbi:energy-coupling factor transporter transmembrane protein EcfT [Paenibacillus sp. 19GGS1-52]|uniref:energy-coupling factor transporter transmembrane component T family protein n=1 Tax=Paenibacillus sp. 19GGS1-52 TaxID=2758563 RepID=UPI001EFBEC7A|nr:energy-coupling factor transporter transmembrane component T [Paenibacillus sp. 19GGS1-52]ULO04912.1 energy-coupling factor transporter transmembrane protein EcfT [Paenibacillus sp. 19GGS1-52]
MMDNIIWGQYINSDSMIHRLDPRTKLLSVLAFTLCCLTLQTLGGYVAATVLVGGQLLLSRVPVRKFFRGLQPILFILSFTFVYHLLVTQEGIESGVFVVWRILLLVSLASVLTLTTKPLDLAKGLEQLFKPLSRFGIPVEAFALMLMIAIRFIPTITQELNRILLAQKARGYDIKSAKGHRQVFAYMLLVVPLLITTIQRAEQLAMTIDARAYGNGKGRTSYRVLKFSQMDYAAGGIMLAFVLLIPYL